MRRLILPASLMIRGRRIAVRVDPRLRERGCDGFFCEESRAILLAHDLAPAKVEETLLHEILHAILPAGDRALLSEADEERIVEFLDAPLARVVRQLRWEG